MGFAICRVTDMLCFQDGGSLTEVKILIIAQKKVTFSSRNYVRFSFRDLGWRRKCKWYRKELADFGVRTKRENTNLRPAESRSYFLIKFLFSRLYNFLQNFVVSMHFVVFVVLHAKTGCKYIQLILKWKEFGNTEENLETDGDWVISTRTQWS